MKCESCDKDFDPWEETICEDCQEEWEQQDRKHRDQIRKALEQERAKSQRLLEAFEYMRKVEQEMGDVILYRYDESLCEQAIKGYNDQR